MYPVPDFDAPLKNSDRLLVAGTGQVAGTRLVAGPGDRLERVAKIG